VAVKINLNYLLVGAACAVIAVLGYQYYQQHHQANGLEINIDNTGVSIKKN
jgi:predicted negative regulator of RcsB-dependent stress response